MNDRVGGMRLTHKVSLSDLETLANKAPRAKVMYSTRTCWWVVSAPQHGWPGPTRSRRGIPTDPQGAVLYEVDDFRGFLDVAKANATYYGKHQLDAFMAAYDGNLVTQDGKPACLGGWDKYNAAIDAALKEGNADG